MKIDLSNIAATPGARGRYSVSEHLAPTEEYSCLGPVTGEITVENTGSLLLVRGHVSVVLRLSCVRCLEAFESPIALEIEEEFATEDTAPDVPTIDRDEPEAAAISNYILDVSELVRQQLLMHLPMASTCRPDCPGICPQCGHSLKQGPCACSAPAPDSPWAKLEGLLEGARQQRSEQ